MVVIAIFRDLRGDLRRIARARNVVLIGMIAWFLLEGITLSPGLRQFDQSTYNFAVLCVLLALVAFLVGYHGTRGTRWFDGVGRTMSRLDDPEVLWKVVLVCSLIGFAPVAYYSGLQLIQLLDGILGMRQTWGGLIGRARYGGLRDAMLMLETFALGAGPLAVMLLLDRRVDFTRKCFCSIVAIWPLLRAYGSGTRSALIMAVLPALAVIYFKCSPKTQRALILGCLIAVPTFYSLMAAMVVSRGSGALDWDSKEKASYVGSEMLQELAYIVNAVPEEVDYQLGHNYYVQLVNPIPRFLWAGKPTLDTGILLAQLKGATDKKGEVYLTNSPGMIGEMYLNFGLLGVVGLSWFGGWLVRGWDRLGEAYAASLCAMIFYCMGLGVLFIMGRGITMNMFYNMMFLYVGVCLVGWLMPSRAPEPSRTLLV